MNIKITSITDAGLAGRERVVMKVLRDTDVGLYAALRTGYRSPSPTTGVTDAYWFPDKPVKRDDLVVLYTKSGSASEKKLASGATAHFFYWGVEQPLWTTADRAVVLLEVNEFDFLAKGMMR